MFLGQTLRLVQMYRTRVHLCVASADDGRYARYWFGIHAGITGPDVSKEVLREMRYSRFSITTVLLMVLLGGGLLYSGGSAETAQTDAAETKVKFPYFIVGAHTGAAEWGAQIQRFNEEYDGQYELIIEEVPGDQNYIEKLKVLYGADQLPAIYELKTDPEFTKRILDNGDFVDLKPFYDAEPEWRASFSDRELALSATEDGRIFGQPSGMTSYIGIYYNKELFAQAGIDAFPDTWSEFWDACDALKAEGINAIALHTTETGWCTNLMVSAYLGARGSEGYDFMRTLHPTDYTRPLLVDAFDMVQRLFQYAPPSAIGGTYPMAANDFYNGNAAMIPNGPWMIPQMRDPQTAGEGFGEKVGYALYPEDVAIGGPHVIIPKPLPTARWHLSPHYDDATTDAALAYLRFIARPEEILAWSLTINAIPTAVDLPDDYYDQLDPIAADLYELVANDMKTSVNGFQGVWDSVVMNEVVPQDMPQLALGQITPEEFARRMEEGALRFQRTQ